MDTDRPNILPPTNLNSAAAKPFWEGLAQHKLLAQACRSCDARFFPPRSHCPDCLEDELDWFELSGRGSLHSWTTVHMAGPEFDTPFSLGLVDLEHGMGRIAAKVLDAGQGRLEVGMPVHIGYLEARLGMTPYCLVLD